MTAMRIQVGQRIASCGESAGRPWLAATPVRRFSALLFDLSAGPDFSHETRLLKAGKGTVCGVDEAGRGPLAGPVVAAAVILDRNCQIPGLNDSKKLTPVSRDALYEQILSTAQVAIASVSASLIDRMNIRAASLEAMRRAIAALPNVPGHALIDGNALPPGSPCSTTALIKGDARSFSIAAASIVAKVTRDRMMERADRYHPAYQLARHKGYPTVAHRTALSHAGPCPLHRRSFAPVAAVLANEKSPSS